MAQMIDVMWAIDEIANPDGWASSAELADFLDCSKVAASAAAAHAKDLGWVEGRNPSFEVGNMRWGLTDAGAVVLGIAATEAHDPAS